RRAGRGGVTCRPVSIPRRTDGPRPHHYRFAHRTLPAAVHKLLPERMQQVGPWVVRSFFEDAVVALWNIVGDEMAAEERIEPDGLRAVYEPGPPEMVLVVMPPARHMAEAHFAAVVIQDSVARYFVLEDSWTPDRADATVIGEWTRDQTHVNYGPGPAA